ncbi:MAG: hypothetical protein QM699_01555 [Amaricoccus sp.]|uniref:hypothetical protein n=1 Tax=Amaricoccus sp. TaxID=1872485 RepID=UPI0039E5FB84
MSDGASVAPVKTTVRLDQLFLAMNNPRHEEVDGEPEAIDRLCRTEDIDALARDIARNGTNPAERLILYPVDEAGPINDKTAYYVAEGNRRVCAMKLLKDPDLAPAKIRNSIKASAALWTAPAEIDAVVISDPDRVRHWLLRIHDGAQGGRGRKPWTSEQKTRFTGSGRHALAQAVLDYAVVGGMISNEDRPGRLSHLARLLSNALVKDALGVDVSRGADDPMRNRPKEEFETVLKEVLKEAGAKNLGSQVRKEKIDHFARTTLQQLPGVSSARVEPEPLIEMVTEVPSDGSGAEPGAPAVQPSKPPAKPVKPKSAANIASDDEILASLDTLGSYKLKSLYYSICMINAEHHTPLIAVGVWTFIECLGASMGKTETTAFKDYFGKSKLAAMGLGSGKELNATTQALSKVADYGNITKHHKSAAHVDTRQLINDMETLTPLMRAALKSMIQNG